MALHTHSLDEFLFVSSLMLLPAILKKLLLSAGNFKELKIGVPRLHPWKYSLREFLEQYSSWVLQCNKNLDFFSKFCVSILSLTVADIETSLNNCTWRQIVWNFPVKSRCQVRRKGILEYLSKKEKIMQSAVNVYGKDN